MHDSVLTFVTRVLPPEALTGNAVLEVGSCDVNGGVRAVLSPHAATYLGVDITDGPGVDLVCDVGAIFATLERQFDVVVSTEMLEHVVDWRAAIRNLASLTAHGGRLVLTTRSHGFPYHAHPIDTWRYEVDDMEQIFAHWDATVESDPQVPGVFVAARKPDGLATLDLTMDVRAMIA